MIETTLVETTLVGRWSCRKGYLLQFFILTLTGVGRKEPTL